MKLFALAIGFVILVSSTHAQDDPFRSAMRALTSIDVSRLMPLKLDEPAPLEDYAALEARTFAQMNWGPDEIAWFRNVYTPLYGNPEDYIRDVAALYDQLDSTNP